MGYDRGRETWGKSVPPTLDPASQQCAGVTLAERQSECTLPRAQVDKWECIAHLVRSAAAVLCIAESQLAMEIAPELEVSLAPSMHVAEAHSVSQEEAGAHPQHLTPPPPARIVHVLYMPQANLDTVSPAPSLTNGSKSPMLLAAKPRLAVSPSPN